jgi:hypothetical protein
MTASPSALERVIASLTSRGRQPKKSGSEYSTLCPAHEDRNASLSLAEGKDGRALIKCHAGCATESVVEALGLSMRDLMPPVPEQNGKARSRGTGKRTGVRSYPSVELAVDAAMRSAKARYVTKWCYHDADEEPVLFVVRGDPKTYRPVSSCPDGWRVGDPKGLLPVYCLPSLGRSSRIVVVEGEKCADTVNELGFVATTSAHGARSAAKSDWSPLAGKHVTIIPDNDAAGRQYARDVLEILASLRPPAVARVVALPGLGDGEDIFDFATRRKGEGKDAAAIREEIEGLPEVLLDRGDDNRANSSALDESVILVEGGNLPVQVAAAELALAGRTLREPMTGVYRRGTALVRPGIVTSSSRKRQGIKQPEGALILHPVDANLMQLLLTKACRWRTMGYRKGEYREIPIDAPLKAVRAALANSPWSDIPAIHGVVHAPTLRADGTVIDQPGYDEDSCLLFDARGTEFRPVSEYPSREEALAALRVLDEPLEHFDFVDDASRSVAVASIITAVVRKTLRTAPLFAFSAPKMASGKSLLASIPSYVSTGLSPSCISQTDDMESERKRLLSLLLESCGVIMIDNVERPFRSESMCTILTETTFTDRLLGCSRTVTVPTNSLFLVTGNNLTIEGDLTSRTLMCELDPRCERPEERTFERNLHTWVPQNRGRLAVAAIAICRAYIVAGCPDVGVPQFGRFEAWSQRVRCPLVWLGCADPCLTRTKIERRDPVREELAGLLGTWYEACQNRPVTVKEVLEVIEHGHDELRAAVEAVAADYKGTVSSRRLGKFLATHERRIEKGLRFEQAGTVQRAARWVVRPIGSGVGSELASGQAE